MHHSGPISGSWLEWAALHPYERMGRRRDKGQTGIGEEKDGKRYEKGKGTWSTGNERGERRGNCMEKKDREQGERMEG